MDHMEGSLSVKAEVSEMAASAMPRKTRVRRKPVPMSELPTDWWEVEDCAKYLGKSNDWVYKKTADGTLPHYKHGHANHYLPAEIVSWAKAQAAGSKKVRG